MIKGAPHALGPIQNFQMSPFSPTAHELFFAVSYSKPALIQFSLMKIFGLFQCITICSTYVNSNNAAFSSPKIGVIETPHYHYCHSLWYQTYSQYSLLNEILFMQA